MLIVSGSLKSLEKKISIVVIDCSRCMLKRTAIDVLGLKSLFTPVSGEWSAFILVCMKLNKRYSQVLPISIVTESCSLPEMGHYRLSVLFKLDLPIIAGIFYWSL